MSEEIPEGSWVMVWRKYEGEGGWYGPGLHLAKSKNNRSHWVHMGARLWKCSREQMRMATDEEGLSKEVAMALSKEVLEDVESGRTARFVDVTSDGGPPADELLERLAPAVPEPMATEGSQRPPPPEVSGRPEPSAPVASVPSTPRPVPQESRLSRLSDEEQFIRLAQEVNCSCRPRP